MLCGLHVDCTQVYYGDLPHQQEMLDWLVADLAEANQPANRAAQPWCVLSTVVALINVPRIIAFGHRPMYW
jgi:hypothetical protein